MSLLLNRLDFVAQGFLARPLLMKSIQTGAVVSLGVVTGIATCMHVWIIPIVKQAYSSRTQTEQFRTTVTLGGRYLQPFSRGIAVVLASMAFVCSRSQNPAIASQWKYYAAAMGVMIPTGPYEITTIFPTNDRLFEIDDELQQSEKENFGDERDQKIDSLLSSWRRWHTGRVLAPFVACSILAWGTADLLPF